MQNPTFSVAIMALFACSGASAASAPELLRQAIDTGQASGQLNDEVRAQALLKLNATGALTLRVTRLFTFKQEGCARLRLEFVQTQAMLSGASAPHDYEWATEMNICHNGEPPLSFERSN